MRQFGASMSFSCRRRPSLYIAQMNLKDQHCKDVSNEPLNEDQIKEFVTGLDGWRIKNDALYFELKTSNFSTALIEANNIGRLADEQNHHPDLCISWGSLNATLFSHDAKALTMKDFVLAAKINQILAGS